MNFDNDISFDTYAQSAETEFNSLQARLTTMDENLSTHLNGRSRGRLAGTFFATFVWFCIYSVLCGVVSGYISTGMLLGLLGCCFTTIFILLLDNIVSSRYYGVILSFQARIRRLKNQLQSAQSSIGANTAEFKASKASGWDYPLAAAPSVQQEMSMIEQESASIRTLQGGLLNTLKNIAYYITAIVTTVAGCMALNEVVVGIISGISGTNIPEKPMELILTIAIVIACVLEIIAAKFMWGHTNCSVRNLTLLATLAGPVLYLIFVAAATLVISLVVGLLYIAIQILIGIVAVGVCLASTSGG